MARRFTFVHRDTRDIPVRREFDITPFEEPGQLYRLGWQLISGNSFLPTLVEFRGFSSENQLVLHDNVMPPGHIMHENLERPVAGQIGLLEPSGLVVLLVMQWRRERSADWEWYSPHAVDWQTFRANVAVVFAHWVLLALLDVPVPAFNWQQLFVPAPYQDVQLLYQTFGSHIFRQRTISRTLLMQWYNEHWDLYGFLRGLVFGLGANDFRPVNFRCQLGNPANNHQENVNLPVATQTVGDWLGDVIGFVHGQLGINARRQLVLLVIKWRAPGEEGWCYYMPQQIPWQLFQNRVGAISGSAVLVAQF